MPKESKKNQSLERPPVVAVMGHIDHGKSTLLDYIRKTNLTEGETGGITQHVAAYETEREHNGKKERITFIDTPGHEAFAGIRSRGANIADIAILVVSAEDGVKPQTLEALEFIKKSETPFVIAITKIDKETASAERAKQSLAEHGIYVEGYGGSISCVSVSSKTGEGVPELLDMILLMAELEELKTDPEAKIDGFILEAKLDMKRGITATIIVKNGTLKSGLTVVSGDAFVHVRSIENVLGEKIIEVSAGSPARLIGWNKIPPIGAAFHTFPSKRDAEKYLEEMDIADAKKKKPLAASAPNEKGEMEKIVTVPLVIKADTSGSVEAIEHELKKIHIDRVTVKIVGRGVGNISENDLKVAAGSARPLVIGFNVVLDPRLGQLPERIGADIKTFDLIYRATEWLTETLKERAPKITVEEFKGSVKILRIFSKSKHNQVVGGKIEKGTLALGDRVRISRREAVIGEGLIRELQQQKNKVREVEEGKECGLLIEAKMEIAVGDRLEAVTLVEK